MRGNSRAFIGSTAFAILVKSPRNGSQVIGLLGERSVKINEYFEALEMLTPKQAVFVEEYVRNGMNGVEAASVAGYKGTRIVLAQQARKVLARRVVQEALKKITNIAMSKAEITVEKILADLELAKSEALIPKVDANGNMKRELSHFLKACELQGKYLKMFSDKVEITGTVKTEHDLSNVPTDVLERMLKLYEEATN